MRKDAQARNPKTCTECKANFVRGHRTKEQWVTAHFCSVRCLTNAKVGVARPDVKLLYKHVKNFRRGKAHWNWKGGRTEKNQVIRHSTQYNEWRKAVYARDHWTCQMCHTKQKHPVAHHIFDFKSFPARRFDITNGQTLCRACHKSVHYSIGTITRFTSITN